MRDMTDILGMIMIGFGVMCLFIYSIKSYYKYKRIEKETRDIGTWVSTTGIITESDVYSIGTGGEGGQLYVRLKYKFSVLGKDYESCHARFGEDITLGLTDAMCYYFWKSHFKHHFKHGVGKPVTVYYSFNNPNRCTLVKSRGWGWLVGAIFTFLMGVLIISELSNMIGVM